MHLNQISEIRQIKPYLQYLLHTSKSLGSIITTFSLYRATHGLKNEVFMLFSREVRSLVARCFPPRCSKSAKGSIFAKPGRAITKPTNPVSLSSSPFPFRHPHRGFNGLVGSQQRSRCNAL